MSPVPVVIVASLSSVSSGLELVASASKTYGPWTVIELTSAPPMATVVPVGYCWPCGLVWESTAWNSTPEPGVGTLPPSQFPGSPQSVGLAESSPVQV